jgi:uncharacterized protein YciI
MQFIVLGYDGKDKNAPARRQKVRADHLALGDELVKSGNLWYGAAMVDEGGNMIGSMYFVDFPSRKELDEYLAKEPYVTGKVWQKTEVIQASVRDPWQFNRPKEWFKKRKSN